MIISFFYFSLSFSLYISFFSLFLSISLYIYIYLSLSLFFFSLSLLFSYSLALSCLRSQFPISYEGESAPFCPFLGTGLLAQNPAAPLLAAPLFALSKENQRKLFKHRVSQGPFRKQVMAFQAKNRRCPLRKVYFPAGTVVGETVCPPPYLPTLSFCFKQGNPPKKQGLLQGDWLRGTLKSLEKEGKGRKKKGKPQNESRKEIQRSKAWGVKAGPGRVWTYVGRSSPRSFMFMLYRRQLCSCLSQLSL